jgi:leucine dehydrogenase
VVSLEFPIDALFERAGNADRVYFAWSPEEGALLASHPALSDVAAAIASDARDFDEHEGIFLERHRETGAVFSAFLHRTTRGQGAGGVRHWAYHDVQALITDGLRLSRGMGRKNALAGLWWGGGKGVIARAPEPRYQEAGFRERLYGAYGRFISSLRGLYVTAEDVGTGPEDMASVFAATRFTTCIPERLGGSGNPSPWTARGVVCAMEAALDHLGKGGLAGKRIALQGVGNVGGTLVERLLEHDVGSVVATEVDAAACSRLRERFPADRVELRLVSPGDASIFDAPCDVFAPNALGGVLTPETIGRLRARVVCGAANNQLLDERRDARALADRGIVHVPDFVANRMGIVNCANEQYGSLPDDPAIVRHLGRDWIHSVYRTTRQVLERAESERTTPTAAA